MPTVFPKAWDWLEDHPIFRDELNLQHFHACLIINVFEDTGPSGSTVSLEGGPWEWQGALDESIREYHPQGLNVHDPGLDSWGATFEEAVLKFAQKVGTLYGSYDPILWEAHTSEVADAMRKLGLSKGPNTISPEARRVEEGQTRQVWSNRRSTRKALMRNREKFDIVGEPNPTTPATP